MASDQSNRAPGPWESITQIKAANAAAGHHWFEPATMRFFDSRIESGPVIGGRYFITSERHHDAFEHGEHHKNCGPRLYSIRRANDDGSISTVGEFQAYASNRAARATASDLARADKAGA